MKFLALPLVFLFSVSFASACSFTPDADRMQSPESNIEKYSHIILATVSGVEEMGQFEGNSYVFDIAQYYKGDLFRDAVDNQIKLTSPGHSCGSFFGEGQVGLFFLNDTTSIDEANPQYFYDSLEAARLEIGELFEDLDVQEEPVVVNQQNKACTREYVPVCGSLQVQCVQAPCDPIVSTYPNTCVMESTGATLLYEGVCEFDKPVTQTASGSLEGVLIGPETGPLDSFVEPLGPPPVFEAPEVEKQTTVWSKITTFIRGLFPWF